MPVDLHTHSTASDGSDRPAELVERAASLGLEAIALTDHDTQQGVAAAQTEAERTGIELIPGVELSLAWDKGGMHLIVLWLAPEPGPLQDRLSGLQESRHGRNALIVGRLQRLGLDITLTEVEAIAGGGSVGRPHIAAVLVGKGYVADIQTAFEQYLGGGRPAYLGRDRLSPAEAIGLATESGAVAVLAHPHTLGVDNRFEMAKLMEELVDAGLIGIETHYGTYLDEGRAGMEAMARRFGLVPSGGSDFHGTFKPDVMLGTGKVGLPVPSRVLDELRGARRVVG